MALWSSYNVPMGNNNSHELNIQAAWSHIFKIHRWECYNSNWGGFGGWISTIGTER